jgi:hypothetical protein
MFLYTVAYRLVAKQWLCKQWLFLGNPCNNQRAVFSVVCIATIAMQHAISTPLQDRRALFLFSYTRQYLAQLWNITTIPLTNIVQSKSQATVAPWTLSVMIQCNIWQWNSECIWERQAAAMWWYGDLTMSSGQRLLAHKTVLWVRAQGYDPPLLATPHWALLLDRFRGSLAAKGKSQLWGHLQAEWGLKQGYSTHHAPHSAVSILKLWREVPCMRLTAVFPSRLLQPKMLVAGKAYQWQHLREQIGWM